MAKLDVEAAVELYYSTTELSNADIRRIFGTDCSDTVQRFKKPVLKEMAAQNVMTWAAAHVDTRCAFEAWGIDIKDLEARLAKLRKLFPEKYKKEDGEYGRENRAGNTCAG